jgi:exodeoxyribonuclease VII small subunit
MAEQTFEEKLTRLEAIVGQMESSKKPLEEVIALFKEGMALSKECKTELNRMESDVQRVLAENDDGTLNTEKLDI